MRFPTFIGNGRLKLMYDNSDWIKAGLDQDLGSSLPLPISATTIEKCEFLEVLPPELEQFILDHIPELVEAKSSGRLCWYTDTFDGNFVVDWVPQLDGCMVVTGGSRHGKDIHFTCSH